MEEKKKLGLTSKIFIGLIAGALLGAAIHYFIPTQYQEISDKYIVKGLFYVIGNGFLRAMQMLVVPLVFCSLVCGSMAIGDSKKLGKVGVKTILFYLLTTALAITVALVLASIINPGKGLPGQELLDKDIDQSSIQAVEQAAEMNDMDMMETLLNIIPKNPISALAEGNMLQIIFFALLIGIILAQLGDSADTVGNFFNQFNDIMMNMTMLVMKVAPYGVFCLVAKTFSEIGFSAITSILKYMFSVLIALAVQCFIVYMLLLKGFTGLNPIRFIKKFAPVMGFAFSTATSTATIPLSIDTLATKIGVSRKIASFTVPLGATINMDGTAIMQGVAVVFAAQAFQIPLTLTDYITVIATATIASIGTAGVPSVGLITLSMVFSAVGLPIEGIALIMGIDRILDMARTAVNITGDAVCTTIVAKQDKMLDKKIFENP